MGGMHNVPDKDHVKVQKYKNSLYLSPGCGGCSLIQTAFESCRYVMCESHEHNALTVEELLERHGVRPTAVRILAYKAMLGFRDTFSLSDLETALDTVDKSSIFRTLESFAIHHVVHEIDDGSGSKKYCVCHNDHECGPDELHCHFYCEKCHKTYCLDHTHIPPVKYPDGFELHQVEYLMKGICRACMKRQ